MSAVRSIPAPPFETRYAPLDTQADARTLARIRFGGLGSADGRDADPRDINVPLAPLDPPRLELWQSAGKVQYGRDDGFGYAHDGRVLFAHLHLPETELEDLSRATLRAYVRIDALARRLGYPHWLRMWNYLSRITEGEGDRERYRRFAEGRYHALALKPGFEHQLPAATAVGSADGGLTVFFLAAREPGQQIENPRQVSAFRYPRVYGPRSPSFARATLKCWDAHAHLYVSGTASIVGHESLHTGDAMAQLDEIHRNIDTLCEQARLRVPGSRFRPQQLKLYLNQPEDLAAARRRVLDHFGADAPLLSLHGKICRNDLLLEVEGLFVS